jgi:ATP-dependent DNA ligase
MAQATETRGFPSAEHGRPPYAHASLPRRRPRRRRRWNHEAKLEGFRCLAAQKSSKLRLWSRDEQVDWLPELDSLTTTGDVVLDGEVAVVTADGWADVELRATRVDWMLR